MKLFIVVFCALAGAFDVDILADFPDSIVSYISAEKCMSADECTITLCANNATVICERGECTCLQQATSGTSGEKVCTMLSDCDGLPHCHGDSTHGHGGSHGHEWHCIDGICRCAGYHP